MKTTNEKLKEIKTRYRVSLRDIAKVAGYSDTSICEWVNNKRELKLDTYKKIKFAIQEKYSTQ